MEVVSPTRPVARGRRRTGTVVGALLVAALLAGSWYWRSREAVVRTPGAAPLPVLAAVVTPRDVAVRLTANGTVAAVQTVEVRPQLSATVRTVHIREGQFVRQGARLFTLDARSEEANLGRAEAQLAKDRADLANAERNLERQRELFRQRFISQAALDTAQNQVDSLRGQVAVDLAALQASRVTRSFSEITAPIAGRTGAIAVYPGSLVQPSGAPLVTITQVDPIQVSFTLPERELAGLQQALAKGPVAVAVQSEAAGQSAAVQGAAGKGAASQGGAGQAGQGGAAGQAALRGRVVFVDNAVDTASGTIRLKAEFANPGHRLWPGMFVTVALTPRRLTGALTVPVQAVQTGPEQTFLYVIGADRKASVQPVKVALVQDGVAVIEGAAAGTRVVVEGAQNLRPGSLVSEKQGTGEGGPANAGERR